MRLVVLGAVRQRFAKSHRLLKPDQFRHVFQGGRKRSVRGLTVYTRPNTLGYPRLGIAIPRRCAPNAVTRNRLKRIIREAFRLRRERLGGVDIVFLGRPGLTERGRVELNAIIDRLLTEIERCEG